MNHDLELVRRFAINTKGRDFVVGDIHGCFSVLEKALEGIEFDPDKDRLFSVGDLVDRGPESLRCLEFLKQPFFHAVTGNHEDMLLNLYVDGALDMKLVSSWVKKNGVEWWYDISDAERARVLHEICTLPFAIEVETANGLVGIIHAEVPIGMDWKTFTDLLRAEDHNAVQACLWARNRRDKTNCPAIAGIERVYAGHTPTEQVVSQGNFFVIDTGVVYGVNCVTDDGHLTLVQINVDPATLRTGPTHEQPYVKVFH